MPATLNISHDDRNFRWLLAVSINYCYALLIRLDNEPSLGYIFYLLKYVGIRIYENKIFSSPVAKYHPPSPKISRSLFHGLSKSLLSSRDNLDVDVPYGGEAIAILMAARIVFLYEVMAIPYAQITSTLFAIRQSERQRNACPNWRVQNRLVAEEMFQFLLDHAYYVRLLAKRGGTRKSRVEIKDITEQF